MLQAAARLKPKQDMEPSKSVFDVLQSLTEHLPHFTLRNNLSLSAYRSSLVQIVHTSTSQGCVLLHTHVHAAGCTWRDAHRRGCTRTQQGRCQLLAQAPGRQQWTG